MVAYYYGMINLLTYVLIYLDKLLLKTTYINKNQQPQQARYSELEEHHTSCSNA